MENKKGVIITIVVLLCIFTPLTIIGLLNKRNISPLEENPNHESFYDGHLWFYNINDNFLSKYECATEICEYTTTIIDDDTYGINYYKEGTIDKVSLIDDKYTFITDGVNIYLYSATTGSTLQTYKSVKTYNTNIENNTYILENSDGVWGVLMLGNVLAPILPFEYSFIGLKNELNDDNTLKAEKFIVKKDNKWFIVDRNNSAISSYIDEPIIDYTNDYIISKDVRVRIFSYEGFEYLTNYEIKDYIIKDKYIGIIINNFLLIYENINEKYIKSVALTNSNSKIELDTTDGFLKIIIDGNVVS